VARFHGQAAAEQEAENFIRQFKKKEIPDEMPVVRIKASEPVWICRLLSEAGLVSSNGEGRRLVRQGGVKVDGEKISDPDFEIVPEGEKVLQAGKRKFARIIFAA
jgi:tyrosyl-tRNA synthetase